ncbi:MAG: N-acetyltransferase [Acidobacteriales bacterium]|nr:N-acetyltransferase [Terriglobales bacterium]
MYQTLLAAAMGGNNPRRIYLMARETPRSRFEYEDAGHTAYLEFDEGDGWITLWHTEVPESFRGRGVATLLAQTALQYARDKHLKVDVICPSVAEFLSKHPEWTPSRSE